MYYNLLFIWTYIKFFFNKFKLDQFYYLEYRPDNIKIKKVSFLYYFLNIFCLRNKNFVQYFILNYCNIDLRKQLIKINNNNQIMLENKVRIKPLVPKGIINNIVVDVKNHRYNLNSIKKNLFKIDCEVPLIFCLLFYENICKIENLNISVNYFGKKNEDNNFFKINDIDKISRIIE